MGDMPRSRPAPQPVSLRQPTNSGSKSAENVHCPTTCLHRTARRLVPAAGSPAGQSHFRQPSVDLQPGCRSFSNVELLSVQPIPEMQQQVQLLQISRIPQLIKMLQCRRDDASRLCNSDTAGLSSVRHLGGNRMTCQPVQSRQRLAAKVSSQDAAACRLPPDLCLTEASALFRRWSAKHKHCRLSPSRPSPMEQQVHKPSTGRLLRSAQAT